MISNQPIERNYNLTDVVMSPEEPSLGDTNSDNAQDLPNPEDITLAKLEEPASGNTNSDNAQDLPNPEDVTLAKLEEPASGDTNSDNAQDLPNPEDVTLAKLEEPALGNTNSDNAQDLPNPEDVTLAKIEESALGDTNSDNAQDLPNPEDITLAKLEESALGDTNSDNAQDMANHGVQSVLHEDVLLDIDDIVMSDLFSKNEVLPAINMTTTLDEGTTMINNDEKVPEEATILVNNEVSFVLNSGTTFVGVNKVGASVVTDLFEYSFTFSVV